MVCKLASEWVIFDVLAGPYAFMDVFDRGHICNHTDETGRYAYKVNLLSPTAFGLSYECPLSTNQT